MQQDTETPQTDARPIIEAIATRRLIRASYNDAVLTLAPHHLFERHGELFVGAYNPAKARRSDEAPKLGYFMLKGLSAIGVTDEAFEPLDDASTLPRETDTLVFAV